MSIGIAVPFADGALLSVDSRTRLISYGKDELTDDRKQLERIGRSAVGVSLGYVPCGRSAIREIGDSLDQAKDPSEAARIVDEALGRAWEDCRESIPLADQMWWGDSFVSIVLVAGIAGGQPYACGASRMPEWYLHLHPWPYTGRQTPPRLETGLLAALVVGGDTDEGDTGSAILRRELEALGCSLSAKDVQAAAAKTIEAMGEIKPTIGGPIQTEIVTRAGIVARPAVSFAPTSRPARTLVIGNPLDSPVAQFNNVTVRGNIQTHPGSIISASYMTAGTLNFGAISRAGLTVIQNELGINSVGNAQIQVNAVRTNELYIDGDIDFSEAGTRQACKGINGLYYSNTKSTASPHILINVGNLMLREADGKAALTLDETGVVLTNGGYNAPLSIQSGGGISLTPGAANTAATTGCFKYVGAKVFDANAPNGGWADLNLSAYCGSRRAVVFLRLNNNGVGSAAYRFRPNGSAFDQELAGVGNYPGLFSTRCDSGNEDNFVMCYTDTSGKVEWECTDTGQSTEVWLLFYVA